MRNMKSSLALMMAFSMVAGTGVNAFAEVGNTGSNTTSAPAVTAPLEVRSVLEGLATVEKINEDKQLLQSIRQLFSNRGYYTTRQ